MNGIRFVSTAWEERISENQNEVYYVIKKTHKSQFACPFSSLTSSGHCAAEQARSLACTDGAGMHLIPCSVIVVVVLVVMTSTSGRYASFFLLLCFVGSGYVYE